MTKRSSLVMPPDRICVAANVDILDHSPKSLMRSPPPRCADLLPGGCMEPCMQGNIVVKHRPIRLSALCTTMSGDALGDGHRVTRFGRIAAVQQISPAVQIDACN